MSFNHRFTGKVVIITGSSAGIGQAAALLFAREGASVTIHGRSQKGLDATQKLLADAGVAPAKILVVQGEIQEESVQDSLINETVAKFGRIDVLVNNAGLGFFDKGKGPLDVGTLQYLMNVNVVSGVRLLQLASPHLEKTKGNCVYVSSIAALTALPENPFYAVSKAALTSWTKTAAVIYGPKGIRVNSVNPGGVRTEFFSKLGMDKKAETYLFDVFIKQVNPLGRVSEPQEQADAIAYIASDQASYVNGSIFVVDGGHVLATPKLAVSLFE